MEIEKIIYTYNPDNTQQVEKFVGGFWKCTLCGGNAEYETESGPKGCDLCNSRLLPFVDKYGKVVMADWGDTIIRTNEGLVLCQSAK